jgi:hypothetical protein
MSLYAGLGLLAVRRFRKLLSAAAFAALLLQPLPLLAGTVIPLVLQELLYGSLEHYSPLQLTNPFWTCVELDRWRLNLVDEFIILRIIWATALFVLALNASSILNELRQVRIAAPPRVVDDDAQASGRAGPNNPWERSDDS